MLSQALRGVWQETTLFGFCVLAIVSVMETGRFDDPAAWLWIIMLVVQSLPYAATVVTAAVSARGLATATPSLPLSAEPQKSLVKVA
jgi:hypothetical protein